MSKPIHRLIVASVAVSLGVSGMMPALAKRKDDDKKPDRDKKEQVHHDKGALLDIDALVKALITDGVLNAGDVNVLNDSPFLNDVVDNCSDNFQSFRQNESTNQSNGGRDRGDTEQDATTTTQCGLVPVNAIVLNEIVDGNEIIGDDLKLLSGIEVEDVVEDVKALVSVDLLSKHLAGRY